MRSTEYRACDWCGDVAPDHVDTFEEDGAGRALYLGHGCADEAACYERIHGAPAETVEEAAAKLGIDLDAR